MAVLQPALKALQEMIFPRYPRRTYLMGRLGDERNYEQLVGDGSGSALVDSILAFIIHGFTQMYPIVARSAANDIDAAEIMAAHPAAQLFRRPTYDPDLGRSWYSWMTMIAGVVGSFCVDGNGYIVKVRSQAGRVVQLWYTPHWMLEPRWNPEDPRVFITHYDYAPYGTALVSGPLSSAALTGPIFPLRVQDVIHIRDGLDPQNTRKGSSKVKRVLREIFTDEEGARYTASLLKNQGVPGIVVSPATDKGWIADKNDADEVKNRLMLDFTGDQRGLPIIMRGPTKVEQYGFSPDDMNLRDLRAVAEERVAMELGVPAAVVGSGAGLEHTKVGRTMEEFVDLAWQNGILPRARIFAAELTEQYLPEFETGAAVTHDFAFDTQRVPIMADYHLKVAQRHEILARSGVEDRGEARKAVGLSTSQRDRVFMLPSGTLEVPSDKTLEQVPAAGATPPAPQLAPGETPPANVPNAPANARNTNGNGNGNGHGGADRVPLDESDIVAKSFDHLDGIAEKMLEGTKVLARATVDAARENGAAVTELATALATKSLEPAAPQLAPQVHFHENAIRVDAQTTVAPGAVRVEPGAIQSSTHIDNGGDIDLVRDDSGRVSGARTV